MQHCIQGSILKETSGANKSEKNVYQGVTGVNYSSNHIKKRFDRHLTATLFCYGEKPDEVTVQ